MSKTDTPQPGERETMRGCADHGCVIAPPVGMGTTGGKCRCPTWKLQRAIRTLTRELAEAQSDNRILRESLAMAYSGPSKLYADDGELTDSSTRPWIDYRRDSVEQIRDKIRERGLAFRAALAPAQEGE